MTRVSKPPQERKSEILSAALELFLQNGYENTSVSDIVERVGVAQGLFYYYFRTKEEVYHAAMEQYADECTARLIAIVQEKSSFFEKIERVLELMEGYVVVSARVTVNPKTLPERLDMDTRLSIHVAQALVDPVAAILEELNQTESIQIENPEFTATFLIFGIFGLIHGNPDHSHDPAFFRSAEVTRIISGILGLTPEQLRSI